MGEIINLQDKRAEMQERKEQAEMETIYRDLMRGYDTRTHEGAIRARFVREKLGLPDVQQG